VFKKQIDNLKTNRHRVRAASLTHPPAVRAHLARAGRAPCRAGYKRTCEGRMGDIHDAVCLCLTPLLLGAGDFRAAGQPLPVAKARGGPLGRHQQGGGASVHLPGVSVRDDQGCACPWLRPSSPKLHNKQRVKVVRSRPKSASRVTLNHGSRCAHRRAGEFRGAVRGVRRGGGYHRGGLCVPRPLAVSTSPLGWAAVRRARWQCDQ
jgi:hypothetical protein